MTLTQCPGLLEESHKSCRRGSFWTSPHVLQKMMKIRGRTHLGTCKQTLSKHKHKNSSLQGNDFSQKQSTTAAKAATTCLQVHTWRTHQKQDRTGAQTNQLWKFSLRWKLARTLSRKPVETSAARKRRKDVFERQMSFEERKQFDPAKQKEIKNFAVNNVLEKLEPHEKPPRECKLRMRWVLEYRLDENEKKKLPSLAL